MASTADPDRWVFTGKDDVGARDLRVGDCFDGDLRAEVESVHRIPSDDPHTYEVFHVFEHPGPEQPMGDAEFAWVAEECETAFQSFVGVDYRDSIYYYSHLGPTPEGWDNGDHGYVCFLHNQAETLVTGSAAGTAR